jgi:hypothetical protein
VAPFTVKTMQLESGRFVLELSAKGETLNAKGQRVERRWSVLLAMSDTEWQAQSMSATLTSVLQHIYEAGRTAVAEKATEAG